MILGGFWSNPKAVFFCDDIILDIYIKTWLLYPKISHFSIKLVFGMYVLDI